jgi:rRNA maturation RNase YbeY
MSNINFFKEDCTFDLRKLKKHKAWIDRLTQSYHYAINELNYVFCSDQYLHQINLEYLNHDTYTDIITFDLRDDQRDTKTIEADVFISINRVTENAATLGTDFEKELARVMAHGVLHLIGYRDKTEEERQKMTGAEDKALQLL